MQETIRQRLSGRLLSKAQTMGISSELWGALPSWQKRQIRNLYRALEGLSNDDFQQRMKSVKDRRFHVLGTMLTLHFSRMGTPYEDGLKLILTERNRDARLLALQNLASDLGIELGEHEPTPRLAANVLVDADIASDQMIDTYDSRLAQTVSQAQRENDGLEDEALIAALLAALLAWHEKESLRQNRLAAISETMKAVNGQWRTSFDDNPQFKKLALVRVVPSSASSPEVDSIPLCSLVAGGVYTLQELESMGYYWPVHPQCCHSNQLLPLSEQPTGVSGQRISIDGRTFEIP